MSKVYNPDCWVILRFTSKEYGVVDKILAGFGGGYTQGSSWKLNSGITKVEDMGEYYAVTGYTGSVYHCYKHHQGLRLAIANVYQSMLDRFNNSEASIEMLDSFEAC